MIDFFTINKGTNNRSLNRLQSPARMVQSSGGGGIAFKLNGGMDGGGMAEVARTTSGENDEGKNGLKKNLVVKS